MKIVISGLTGSGKSTLARGLSMVLNLEYFSASSKLREILPKKDFGVWESKKGLDVLKFRLAHPESDAKLDRYIIKNFSDKNNVVLDSWVAPWKVNGDDIIKIYIKADVRTRSKRVAFRDSINFKSALAFTKKKDEITLEIYKKLYGIEVGKDYGPFDIVLDSGKLSADDLIKVSVFFIKTMLSYL